MSSHFWYLVLAFTKKPTPPPFYPTRAFPQYSYPGILTLRSVSFLSHISLSNITFGLCTPKLLSNFDISLCLLVTPLQFKCKSHIWCMLVFLHHLILYIHTSHFPGQVWVGMHSPKYGTVQLLTTHKVRSLTDPTEGVANSYSRLNRPIKYVPIQYLRHCNL